MKQKKITLAFGGVILAALIAAAFFYRPITIRDGEQTTTIRRPIWTTGQALASAGISLSSQDQVMPELSRLVPLSGEIQIQRAVQAYLWENGHMRSIQGIARTPRELLRAAGIQITGGDRLLWNGETIATDTVLPTGVPILLQLEHARTITLDLQHQRVEVSSHAPTTAAMLWEQGIMIGPGDRLSAAPGSPLASGMTVEYRAARPLTIHVRAHEVRASSAAQTVGDALAEDGVSLQGLDYSQPGEDQPVPADGHIRVVRVREEFLLTQTLLPFESQYAPDPDLELDQVRPMQPGIYGVEVTRERVRMEDGREISRTVDSDWVVNEPVPQTIGYGTKVVTFTADTSDGTIEYWRKIRVYATSYSPCRLGTPDNRCGYTTASGLPLKKGVIGVSRAWFNAMRGQQVYVPGYGYGVIADYGAVSGMRIDLGFDDTSFEEGAMVGWVDMYFLTPVPAVILWTLP